MFDKKSCESIVFNRIRELEERKSNLEKSTQTETEAKEEPSKEDKVLDTRSKFLCEIG